MKIYFQLPNYLIDNINNSLAGIKSDIDSLILPPLAKKILRITKERIELRFKIFENEIDMEDKENKESYILMDFSNHPVVVKYINYTPQLTQKMEQSFTQDDLDYLERYGQIK